MRPAPLVASALAVAVLIGGASCSSSAPPAATPATASPPAPGTTRAVAGAAPSTIYANDPAKPVSAKVGETIALRVDADPAAPETWEVVSYEQGTLFEMGASYDETASTLPGRTATQNLLFRATAPGTAKVVLRYGAPGTPMPSDSTVTFTVTVT